MSYRSWISRAKLIDKVKNLDHEVEAYLKELDQLRAGKRVFTVSEEEHKILNSGRKKWKRIINNPLYKDLR